MRIPERQVHQLHGGEAHHHEPFPHQPSGAERGKDRFPEKSGIVDMERLAGHGQQDRGQAHRPSDHRILRCVFQRL